MASAPELRLTRKGQATRNRIVETAARLMFERGVAGTTTEDLQHAARSATCLQLSTSSTRALSSWPAGCSGRPGGVYRLPDRELITKYYAVCPSCGGYREGAEPLEPLEPICPHATSSSPVPRAATAFPNSASSRSGTRSGPA